MLILPIVTSLAEVWIETTCGDRGRKYAESLPLRKCGLKPKISAMSCNAFVVTSLAEVWIETTRRNHVTTP